MNIHIYFVDPNSWLFWVYWVSVGLAFFNMFLDTVADYNKDVRSCTQRVYTPQLTIGIIIIRLIVVMIPVVNTIIAIHTLLSKISKFIISVFDFPLVRHRPNKEHL